MTAAPVARSYSLPSSANASKLAAVAGLLRVRTMMMDGKIARVTAAEHAGHADVDAVLRLAGDFNFGVEALWRCADDVERFVIF